MCRKNTGFLLFISVIALILQKCWAAVNTASNTVPMPFAPPLPPSAPKCNNSNEAFLGAHSALRLQFRLPFIDMEIQNEHNLHMMQEGSSQQLFVLHGNELYQLLVNGTEKRLVLVALLAASATELEARAAEVILWRQQYLLLAVAMEEFLAIYQMPISQLDKNIQLSREGKARLDSTPIYEPVQKITFTGRFRKIFLVQLDVDKVMLITAVNYTKLNARLRTYEWSHTYFDLLEELTVPAMHVLNVIGNKKKYLINGRLIKYQGKTAITVNEITMPRMQLRHRQTLTLATHLVHSYTFRGRNYLFACTGSAQQEPRCNVLRMSDGVFAAYRQLRGKEFTFEKLTACNHFLVGARQREVLIYPNDRMNCFGRFTTNQTDVSRIFVHESIQDEVFVVLTYRRPFNTLVRIAEVVTEDGQVLGKTTYNETESEDDNILHQHRNLLQDLVNQLRSLLLRRRNAMDVFRSVAKFMEPRAMQLQLQNPLYMHAGKIGTVRVNGEQLRSPLQLLQSVDKLRAKYLSKRIARSLDTAATENTSNMPFKLKVKRLEVGNLIYNGTLIEGFHLENSTQSLPILTIRVPISTKTLNTKQLLTRNNYRQLRVIRNGTAPPQTTLRVRDLTVKRINNVSVADFFDSLFLRNRDHKIQGRLILQAPTTLVRLNTLLLNDFVVSQLFNLKQSQTVDSKLHINGVSLQELHAEKVNGLNFADDIAMSGKDDIIEGPVEFQHISIADDLLLAYKPKQVIEDDGPVNEKFQQFYTGKVVINGTLTVTNLEPDDASMTVFEVNGKSFSAAKLRENYFLQNTPQSIHTPVIFGNAKVTTPSITTSWLNDHPTEHHLLNTPQTQSLGQPLRLVFVNATVQGNLICPDHTSKLRMLHDDAVRYGDIANITGVKNFLAPLRTAHLMTLQLNELPAEELVLKSQLQHDFRFYGNKSFDKLVVTEAAYIDSKLNCNFVNGLPLSELLQYNYHLNQLQLPFKLQTHNIVFHRINGMSYDEIFSKFNVSDTQLVLHKDLQIDGNVRFTENLQVETINDIRWQQYCESLVRLGENAVIGGPKQFLQNFTINNVLRTPTINNKNISAIFPKILSQTLPQLITGSYSFNNMRATNIDVYWLNDVPTHTFMDMRAERLVIAGDLYVPKLTVHGTLRGNFIHPFEFETLHSRLQRLVTCHQWRNIVVHGNAHWNEAPNGVATQTELLRYIQRHAVRRTGDQVISGNVRLRQPLIRKMHTNTSFPRDVDLDFIARDCLLKNTTALQTLNGTKTFLLPVQLARAIAPNGMIVNNLNGVDVLRLNASLYYVSGGLPITGSLHFRAPAVVGQLHVQGLVNGVQPSTLYYSSEALVPPLRLRKLTVRHSMELQEVNDISLDFMLANRITLHGPPLQVSGHLTFERLVLNKHIVLQSINRIPVDSLVYTRSADLQSLNGAKSLAGELELVGPAIVLQLNGRNLVDTCKQSLLTRSSYRFNNLTLHEAMFAHGLILNTPVARMEEARVNNAQVTPALQQLEAELDDAMNDTAPLQNEHLLYLDFDLHTEVLQQSSNETNATEALLIDRQHVSACAHQLLQLQQSALGQRIYLNNITTNFVTARAGKLSVKAQNYCEQRYKKVRSKITVHGRHISKVFGMKKYIEHIEIYAHNETCVLLLLHGIDVTDGRHEIRILRVEDDTDSMNDWQSLRYGVGLQMHLFKFDNYTAVVSPAVIENKRPVVSVYHFMPALLQFKLAQVIDGDYNLMELVAVQPSPPARYQLILSCRECQQIDFFEYVPAAQAVAPYQSFQQLKLQTPVGKLHGFRLQDGNLYLLVLAPRNGDFYHLYRYSFVQGWLKSTHGYFHNTQLAVPLNGKVIGTSGQDLLLLLCGGADGKCSLVKAFVKP